MRRYAAGFAVLIALPPGLAKAQTAMERIEPRLARALAEHRVFLTCADGKAKAAIASEWRQMIAEARSYLADRYTSNADLAAFDQRTQIEAVELPKDTSPQKREAFCNEENKGWLDRYSLLNFTYKIDETPP